MNFYIEFSDNAKNDIAKHKKAGNKTVLNKLNSFLLENLKYQILNKLE